MFAGVLILWVIDGRIKREVALHALISSLAAWVVAAMIKELFPTLRPFQVNGNDALVLFKGHDGSFPSGHTAAAFGLAIGVWLHDKKIGSAFIVGAIIIGASRVLANVHYPIDILGGVVIGTVVAFIVDRLHVYNLLSRKKTL